MRPPGDPERARKSSARIGARLTYVDPEGSIRVFTPDRSNRMLALPGRPPGLPVMDGVETPKWPSWSSTGEWIAAAGATDDGKTGGVFVFDAHRSRRSRWIPLQSAPMYSCWLPGHKAIGALLSEKDRLHLFALDATRRVVAPRSIAKGMPLCFHARPDGTEIAIHTTEVAAGPGRQVRLWDTREVPESSLVLTQRAGRLRSPAFSPHGALLAYGERSERGRDYTDLCVVDLKGKKVRPPIAFKGQGAASFSRDGRHLALLAGEVGNIPLFGQAAIVSAWGGEPSPLHEGPIGNIEWVDDSRLIAIVAGESGVHWVLFDRRSGSSVRISPPLSPTRDALFYAHFFDQFSRTHPLVSANGRYAAYAAQYGGDRATVEPHIFLLDLESPCAPEIVGPGMMPAWELPSAP